MSIVILDGPLGTELLRRGTDTKLPLWSAAALRTAPDVVSAIHRDYAEAGAMLHTANTFRTKRRYMPDDWREMTELALRLARDAALPGQRVAASIAPLADCYQPLESPAQPREEHAEFIDFVASLEPDVLIVETFPHVGEACIASEEALRTGIETWLAFTAGPEATLLSPEEMRVAGERAVEIGVQALLCNCTPASKTLPYVEALCSSGARVGAYANAGAVDEGMGWRPSELAASRYADFAQSWVDAGARIIGSCCGTGPSHIAELKRRFG